MNDSANRLRRVLHLTWRQTRRVVIGVVGVSVLIIGVIMIIAPGPAFVVIPAGLAILALEFVWARRMLRMIKIRARRVAQRKRRRLNAAQPSAATRWWNRQLGAVRFWLRRQRQPLG